jgi:hypothetical protein
MRLQRSSLKLSLALVVAAAIFATTTHRLKTAPRYEVRAQLRVALPLFVQVAMTMGDRYLAANLATIEIMVVDTSKMRPDEFAIQAQLQQDVSWLNPGNEDNYYVAAAILSWANQVDAAQNVLARATDARPYDYQPAFYYGFNQLHFRHDPAGASAWLRQSAEHLLDGPNKIQMLNLAAIWLDRTDDLSMAIIVVENMAKQATRPDFRKYLELRVQRLQGLKTLRDAAVIYRQHHGKAPTQLDELVTDKLIPTVPVDPFGFGYDIDAQGNVVLRSRPPAPKPTPSQAQTSTQTPVRK